MQKLFRRSCILILAFLVAAFSWGCEASTSLATLEITNCDRMELVLGSTYQLKTNAPKELLGSLVWESSGSCLTVDQNGYLTAIKTGTAAVTVSYGELKDTALIKVVETPSIDPSGVDEEMRDAFYGDSDPADSYEEALLRSSRGELSGAETVPDQAPVLASYRPTQNGSFIRNNVPYFADENTYVVVNAYGVEVFRVYRGGGYITLEEVAAYVYAFGDVPANYTESKRTEPEDSIWGENLRLNHTKFSGNTEKYPYEPELPDISGCGGDLYYYEIDIGTTGTDCDPGYSVKIYNDGQTITRGAARIVYTRYDANHNEIIDPNEKYLFYTYNHYNDFQEYLNYFGGWGEMFGNVTGGGKISSKTDYNPTPYVPVTMGSLLIDSEMTVTFDPRFFHIFA